MPRGERQLNNYAPPWFMPWWCSFIKRNIINNCFSTVGRVTFYRVRAIVEAEKELILWITNLQVLSSVKEEKS